MTTDRENLLGKIRALLSKTTVAGCTKSEAMAALTKAQAMIDAYEVTDEELALTKEEKAILRKLEVRDPLFIRRGLMFAVERFTNTEAWYQSISRGHYTRTICGLPADVDFAEWLIDSLTLFVQSELAAFLMSFAGTGREEQSAKRSFVMGCIERISGRLAELAKPKQMQSSNSRALVVTKQAAIQECMAANNIKLTCGGGSCGPGDMAAYGAGRAAGGRASLGRPLGGRSASLLTH
ncbi:MAG: DUF2786 domain-containing protein [Xanthobacteraceae bacterium]